MVDRQRSLPSWMTKKAEKMQKEAPRTNPRKRKTASAVFYCMNEKELVEVANSILHSAPCEDVIRLSDRPVAPIPKVPTDITEAKEMRKEKFFTSDKIEKLVMEGGQPLDHSHIEDRTYVSETDLDITELETLPYASSPLQRSRPFQDCNDLLHVDLRTGNAPTAAEAEDEDDEDGFQLVREIFFS